MLKPSTHSRFLQRYIAGPKTECWLWLGTTSYGYGSMFAERKKHAAHRLSWEVHFGPIPDGLYVLHKCDVRACVNPDHLFLGTHLDNMADKFGKGRCAKGAGNGSSKLTLKQVMEIKSDTRTYRAIASDYGIHNAQVSNLKNGKSWKHLEIDNA